MPNFNYTAMDVSGKEVKGTIEAADREDAQAKIRAKGLTTLKLDGANALNSDIELSFLEKKPKPREMSVFCNQMLSVLEAGVSMGEALKMIGDQTPNKKLQKAIRGCQKGIEGGSPLAECMKQYDVFPEVFATMVAAGEATGSLEVSFRRMGERFEKDAKLKGMIKSALMYPIVVAVVAVVVVIVMLTFVVPKFQDTLNSLGTDLPAITKAVIGASEFIMGHIPLCIGIVVAVAVAFSLFKKSDFGKHVIDKIVLKIPIFGPLVSQTACSNLARTLATVLASGVQMVEALDIVRDVMTNVYYKEAMEKIKDEVVVGTPLSTAMFNTKLFPSLLCNMAKIGEETGNLVEMFDRTAGFYDDEVAQATESMTALMEPMIIVVLAGLVGTIVLALMLPMASMYTSMDNL